MSERRQQTFHVVTVVWGRSYVELFLNVVVPNQMTPGNLGALPAGSRYRVFTSPEDVETLAASPILGRVKAQMPVDLVVMPELSESAVNALDRLIAGHRQGLAYARESRAALVFLNADHFMSEGALAAVVRRHATGIRAVASTGVRLNKDTFIAALRERGGGYTVPSRELVSLALDNLHPFTLAHMIDGKRTARWPISIYWNVPGDGILARAFYLHPLMIDSASLDALPHIDAKYLGHACPDPNQIHLVCDSDELCLFELSHVDAAATDTVEGGIPLWRAATVLGRCDAHQQSYWGRPVRLHMRDIGSAWRLVDEESARFADRAMQLRFVALWLHRTSRRLRPLRKGAGAFRKRLRRAARPLSPQRVRRSVGFAAQRVPKLRERAARDGRHLLRRARRTVVLMAHSAARPLHKFRKQATRVGRRMLRRARVAQ